MAVNNYDITAAAFQPDSARKYELSILTGVDSFAYIIRDRTRNELLAYVSHTLTASDQDDWPEAVHRIIQEDDKLRSLRYGTTLLGWESERLNLVPTELFDPAAPRSYLEQLTLVRLEDEVRTELLNELDAQLVYAAPAERLAAAERRLSPLRTQHVAGGLLVAWGARSRRLSHQAVTAAIRGNRLFVAAHQNGQLNFYNSFAYGNSQDALYFLLLAYQQCGWTPNRVPLYLCGEITDSGDLYRQFYRYVEDIRFCQYGAPPATPPELAVLPPHLYFDLLCLS